MNAFHSSLRNRRVPRERALAVKLQSLVLVIVLLLTSCGGSTDSLRAEVIEQFDVGNNSLADLTSDASSELVSRDSLMAAVARAREAGTELRIVVAARDDEFVSAKSVVDRYGGTAISFQDQSTGFEAASRDMGAEQLDRAVSAAKVANDISDSTSAFVDVIETEGVQAQAYPSARTVLLVLLVPAAVFMLWGAWSYVQARKRRLKRQRDFDERKWVLTDWAKQLGPEVESLRSLAAASPDDATQKTWHDSHDFVGRIVPTLENATSVGELDAAEMRIGRTAIKLRDLRQLLER